MAVTDANRHLASEANDRIAASGERVMVVAQRDLDPATFAPDGDLLGLVTDLTLLAMVGIVDPPRSEAKTAIAECRAAGIRVRMITGDHATTAAAIAGELGIELQRIFDTVELTLAQWSICIGLAASLVVVEELIKLVIRQRDRRRDAATPRPEVART